MGRSNNCTFYSQKDPVDFTNKNWSQHETLTQCPSTGFFSSTRISGQKIARVDYARSGLVNLPGAFSKGGARKLEPFDPG